MQQTRLSPRSKNLLFTLKELLLRYRLDLKIFIFKSFGEHKRFLNDHEFQNIFRYGDDRISYDDIEQLFNELQVKMMVDVDILANELNTVQRPDLMLARFENDEEIPEDLRLSLKEVQSVMLKEDPYYVFDIYDENKDERLHLEQLNTLLMGCSNKLANNVELRRQTIKCLLRYANRRSISRQSFFQIFGMKNIPPRVKFDAPPAVQEVQEDDEIIKKCITSSKIFSSKHSVLQESSLINSITSISNGEPNFRAMKYFRLGDYRKYAEMIGLLEFYLNNDEVFNDPEGPKNGNAKYSQVKAEVIFKNRPYYLFQMAESVIDREASRIGIAQLIEPKDIIQGSIGDCYFLSSISSIVWRYPEHIIQLFLFDVNPAGFYVVRLFNDGEWGNIVLDDKFPCDKYGTPAFARPHTNQIWVMLLEKAWAKINISYENIDLGSSLEGLVALTGAPCKYYRKEDEQVMDRIKEAWEKKWLCTCSGSEFLNEMKKQDATKLGLIGKHAYSVLKLIEVTDHQTGQKLTLIRMRNPWGDLEWRGDWSFTSPKWTPQLREKFNYKKNPQDGSFFMPWKQFEKHFGSVTVCSMIKGNVNSSLRIRVKRHKSTFIEMKVLVSGNYTISLYQQSKRKYKNSQNYKLSESRLIIMKQIPKKENRLSALQYVTSGNKSTSNVHLTTFLEKGTYFVSAKVAWRLFEEHQCVVASYGPSPVDFQLFTDRGISKYFKEHLINSYFTKFRGTKSYYTKIDLNDAYREVCVNLDHGIGYIFFGNPTSSTFNSTINFKNAKGIKLIKPFAFPLQVSIAPDTESLYGMFISGQGYSYVMQQKVKVVKG